MRKILLVVLISIVGVGLLFTACGVAERQYDAQFNTSERDYAAEALRWDLEDDMAFFLSEVRAGGTAAVPNDNAPLPPVQSDEPAPVTRMRIRDVNATVETRQFDRTLAAIQASALENLGYVQSIDISDRHTRHANIILRVPAGNLDDFLESLEEDDSHVANLRDAVRDVTMQHNDMQAEMTALRSEEEALLRLMGTAGDLADLLAVQTQLSNVRHRINRLEGQIRILQDQVAYSTVNLSIQEVERIVDAELGFWARTWEGFVSSLLDVGNSILAFISGVFAALPWLIIIVLPLMAVAWFIIRKIRKKIKQKKSIKEFE